LQAATAISHHHASGSSTAFGMEIAMSDMLTRSRLHTGAYHLHALGPRAVAEFIEDLAKRIGGLPAAVGLLAEYSSLLPPRRPSRRRVAGGGAANDARSAR
jgi:hypothetical protein